MRMKWIAAFILGTMISTGVVWSQERPNLLTLEESIKIAMDRSLALHTAVVGINGSEFRRKEPITNFIPWWTGQYGYTRYSSPVTIGAVQVTGTGTVALCLFIHYPMQESNFHGHSYLYALGIGRIYSFYPGVYPSSVVQLHNPYRVGVFSIVALSGH